MAAMDGGSKIASGGFSAPSTAVGMLLGIALILAGVFVLGDVALASIIGAVFIGVAAILVGAFEIIHAFWTKGWGGFVWQIVLGALYLAFGIVLVTQPLSGALVLTYVLGLLLLISGIVRIVLSYSHWNQAGWIMRLSGLFGILAGVVILTGFPRSGLWVLGLLLGIDLIAHGAAWLAYVWLPAVKRA